MERSTVLVTGGAGFISSEAVRQLVTETEAKVVNVDKLAYAGNLESLASVTRNPRYLFEQVDICERTNLEVVDTLCALLDERLPDSPHRPHVQLIEFVADRPGHDYRYAIDCSKIEHELGWRPAESFDSGLAKTLQWYLENERGVGVCRTAASGGSARDRTR